MDEKKNSRIPSFFNLNREEKIKIVKKFADLSDEEIKIFEKGALNSEIKDSISENVVANFSLPYGIAVNFLINQKDYLVPMVIEEPSVVAAACYGAKLLREGGGITAENLGNSMIGQIYFTDIDDAEKIKERILTAKKEIIELANSKNPVLFKLGGGAKDLEVKVFEKTKIGVILRVHLIIDTKDAMGANTVDTMVEGVAPLLEKITKAKALLKIVSNLADKRLVKVKGKVLKKSLTSKGFKGKGVVERIVKAYGVAEADIYRAVTNNKGILNGMGAVVQAILNDWRALEAGAHGYASKSGKYLPLAKWEKDAKGDLIGEMTVPVVIGTVGGVIQAHDLAKISLKILGVKSAQETACVIASVGLAQNLAALRALVSEGIQEGHMKLHNRTKNNND